jgi:hemerythrin
MSDKVTLWKNEFLVDVDIIDTQHRKFFHICEDIAALYAEEGDLAVRDLILRIFELRTYAFFHFHTEEELMAKYGYPGVFRHFQEHDKYLKALRDFGMELQGACENGEECRDPESLRELAEKINNHAVGWWSEHILHCDPPAMEHIKKKKRADPM